MPSGRGVGLASGGRVGKGDGLASGARVERGEGNGTTGSGTAIGVGSGIGVGVGVGVGVGGNCAVCASVERMAATAQRTGRQAFRMFTRSMRFVC